MRRALGLAAILTMGGAGMAGCGQSAEGVAETARPSAPTIATTRDSAVFTVDCGLSHRAQDDPIVHPGMPGMSHPHDFFGNTTTDGDSDGRSLVGRPTTCEDRDDTAAYWSPAIVDGERFVEPTLLRAYYRAAPGADAAAVRVPPLGLQLLAGDMHTPEGQHTPVSQVGWGCGLRPKRWRTEPPQDCTDRSPLTLHLTFPDCWDGENVRSADHRSHVAYSTDGRCPSTHPVPILQTETATEYPVTGSTAGLRLASGGWQTAHGDFLNAWDPAALRQHTRLCIRPLANCTIG